MRQQIVDFREQPRCAQSLVQSGLEIRDHLLQTADLTRRGGPVAQGFGPFLALPAGGNRGVGPRAQRNQFRPIPVRGGIEQIAYIFDLAWRRGKGPPLVARGNRFRLF